MIHIVPPPADRREDLYDLAAKVFGGSQGYFAFLRACREGYFEGSTYDPAVSRVAMDGDAIVAHVGIWQYRMRVGRARLRTGGVGAVMTHGDYRKRGIAARVFRAVVEAMKQGDYDFSVLFGIRDFYHRFGFVPAFPTVSHTVEVARLVHPPLKLRLRRVGYEQAVCGRGAIMRIYNREFALRTGSAERPIYTLIGGLSALPDQPEAFELTDASGRARGYVVVRAAGEELKILEVGGLGPPCGVDQIVAALARLSGRRGCKRLVVEEMSHAHPLCVALRGGDCQVQMRHTRSGSAMARAISLRRCLDAMADELSERLAPSPAAGFAGRLRIAGDGETVDLLIARGRVRVEGPAGRTPHRIAAGPVAARLILGSDSPAALTIQSGVRYSGEALALAEALFPGQWPTLSQIDHF